MPKTVFYTTIENQIRADGSKGLLYDHFDDLNLAKAKWHSICMAVNTSKIPYHSAHILRSDGVVICNEVNDQRETPEPTPEPTEE